MNLGWIFIPNISAIQGMEFICVTLQNILNLMGWNTGDDFNPRWGYGFATILMYEFSSNFSTIYGIVFPATKVWITGSRHQRLGANNKLVTSAHATWHCTTWGHHDRSMVSNESRNNEQGVVTRHEGSNQRKVTLWGVQGRKTIPHFIPLNSVKLYIYGIVFMYW